MPVLGPSGEPLGTGGSLGNGGDNYQQFQQQYRQQGFMSNLRTFGSALSNIGKLNSDIEKLVGSNGTIAKLQQALDGLTARLNGIGQGGGIPGMSARGLPTGMPTSPNGGGSTFTIGQTPWESATALPQGSQGTPSSGTGGSSSGGSGINPHTRGTAYLGAATFAVGGISNMLDTRMQRSIDLAPGATSLQMPSGLSYRQVNQILSNRTLTYGTTGGEDSLAAAAQAQALAGRGMMTGPGGTMNPVFRQTMGNISQIALTNPGMSLTEAGGLYAALRSPEVNWWSTGMRLPTFTGPGRTSPSFAGTATSYLQQLLPNATAAQRRDPNYLYGQFQQGMPGYAAGVQFLGGAPQLQAVLNATMANMQYQRSGGRGNIFDDIQQDTTGRYINRKTGEYTNAGWRQYEREARLGGYSNEVIAQTRNLQNLDSKNTMLFSASQETNIARSLAVQISIRDNVEKIARKIGALGPAASAANSALSAVTGNPIVDVMLGAILRGGLGGGGAAATGETAAATTAEAGATTGATGLGIAGILGASVGSIPILPAIGAALLGQITKTKIHNMSKGKGFWGGFGKALYYGTGASLSDAAFSDVSTMGMGVAHGVQSLGHFLTGDPPAAAGFSHFGWGDIGDPSQDDISLLESRSNTGHADSVTNLNPTFRAEVARMFRDNPSLRLNSGWRSIQEQQAIWDRNGHDPNVAAPPGSSLHEKGLAVDVGPSSQYSWLHSHGGKYGLVNYEPEPWHWEPAGASNAGNRSNYGVMPDSKAGKVSASGTGTTGTQAAASTATSSTAISGGRSFGGFGGMSQGALMQSLIGSGTQLGLISFTGATSFGGGDTTSTAAASGADASAASSGGGGGKVGNVGNIKTALDFAHALEKAEGWPQSASNDSVLVAWQKAEGLQSASYFNPLNTTQKESGATYGGGAVGHYKDWTMGVQATVDALNSGNGQWYAAIRNGFAQSMDPHQLARIISGSQWAGGHYNDNPPGSTGGTIAQNLANVGDPPGLRTSSASVLRALRSGVGDPPVRTTVMASVPSMGGHRLPVQATFNLTVQNASQNEAEQFAQYAWKRLKQLDDAEARRSV